MVNTKRQLAKIYYQDREVKYINISFDDLHHSIYIGSATHISGKHEIINLSYELTENNDDSREKQFTVVNWEVKSHLDKVETNHIDSGTGLMIKWLSPHGNNFNIKASLFIPMVRILHISVDNPESGDIPESKEPIPR